MTLQLSFCSKVVAVVRLISRVYEKRNLQFISDCAQIRLLQHELFGAGSNAAVFWFGLFCPRSVFRAATRSCDAFENGSF